MTPGFTITNETNRRLRPSIEAATRVADYGAIHVGADSLRLVGGTTDNSAMAEVTIDLEGFDAVDTTPGELHVDFDALHAAIREVNKTSPISLEADPSDEELRVTTPETGEVLDTVAYIDPDDARSLPDRPGLDWAVDVTLPGSQFKRLTRASKKLSSHLTLAIAPEGPDSREQRFKAYAAGDSDELYGYPDHTIDGHCSDTMAGIYRIDLLRQMALAVDRPASHDVTLSFAGDEFPVQCTFQIGDTDATSVSYLIAPRISESVDPEFAKWTPDTPHLSTPTLSARTSGERGKALFEAMAAHVDQYRVLATPDGLESRAVDSANVTLNSVTVTSDYFDDYTTAPELQGSPLGLSARFNDYLTLWRKRDTFELHYSTASRRLELVHDQFRYRVETIDPTNLRRCPELPDLEQTGRATVEPNALTDAVTVIDDATDTWRLGVTDGGVHAMTDAGEDATVHAVDHDTATGRVHSLLATDYTRTALDAAPRVGDVELTLTGGVEQPTAFAISFGDGAGRFLSLIAPRVETDGLPDIDDITPAAADYSWATDPDAATDTDLDTVSVAPEIPSASISDRADEYRYRHYPITTTVRLPCNRNDDDGSGEETPFTITHADKLATPSETLTEIKDEVADRVPASILEDNQDVAEVRLTDDTSYSIEIVADDIDDEYRLTTACGHRFRNSSSRPDQYSYHSSRSDTPARRQVVLAALATDDEPARFEVAVAMTPYESPEVSAFDTLRGGFETMPAAYNALVEYIQGHTIKEMVADAGVDPTIARRTVLEDLEQHAAERPRWELQDTPASSDYFAVLRTAGQLLPDTQYEAQIIVEQPDDHTEPYTVRYVVSMTAQGPGTAAVRDELAADTIGAVRDRRHISTLVGVAFDAIATFGDWYATTDPGVTPPGRIATDSDDRLEAWLPSPKPRLIATITSDHDEFPLDITDVSGIGSSRAAPFQDADISDLIELTAHDSGQTTRQYSRLQADLPEPAEENLEDALTSIWTEYIWPNRSIPGSYDEPAPGRLLQSDTATDAASATPATDTGDDSAAATVTEAIDITATGGVTTTRDQSTSAAAISPAAAARSDSDTTTGPDTGGDPAPDSDSTASSDSTSSSDPVEAIVKALRTTNGVEYLVTPVGDATLPDAVTTAIRRAVAAETPEAPCQTARTVATVTITDTAGKEFDVDVSEELTAHTESGLTLPSA